VKRCELQLESAQDAQTAQIKRLYPQLVQRGATVAEAYQNPNPYGSFHAEYEQDGVLQPPVALTILTKLDMVGRKMSLYLK
jgi:hypothetical protein